MNKDILALMTFLYFNLNCLQSFFAIYESPSVMNFKFCFVFKGFEIKEFIYKTLRFLKNFIKHSNYIISKIK